MFGRKDGSGTLRRIQRCWLRYLLALLALGSCLGPLGFGGSRWDLAGFGVVFVAVCLLHARRALRPGVRLVSSMRGGESLTDAGPQPTSR